MIDKMAELPLEKAIALVESDQRAAILADSGLYADALSTAVFVMGARRALARLPSGPGHPEAVIVSACRTAIGSYLGSLAPLQATDLGAVVVAEDMSGMPGLCRPIEDGGLGFTHRLAMVAMATLPYDNFFTSDDEVFAGGQLTLEVQGLADHRHLVA